MRPLLFFVLLVVPFSLAAQNRTNIWELSYYFGAGYPKCELNFNVNPVEEDTVQRNMPIYITDASICDTTGLLLFYTNGILLGNRNYDTLYNSVDFNPGWATTFNDPHGMSNCQGVVCIPYPLHPNLYYLFHETGESFIAHNQGEVEPLHLSFSVVDINLDGGLGGIVDTLKNKYCIIDTLTWGGLTACKHANGKDWWVIVHRYYSDEYYKLLVTEDSIKGPYEQHIGSVITKDVDVQAVFSPDGSKFCFSNHGGWFDYMDFDRCTGEFSNAITAYSPDTFGLFGCSFSPNSRFLYVSSFVNMYQYDTWNSNMIANGIHVAAYDGFTDPLGGAPMWFFMHQLAPDGKIYLSTFNGGVYLHVIADPDSLGTNCNFQQHSFAMPPYTYTDNIPSFPNYDLGALPGDSCDAVYTHPLDPPSFQRFIVAPNPVSNWLNIVYETSADGLFELFDINGKRVAATSLYHYFKNRLVDVSNLPAGLYLATITQNGKQVWKEKVIIFH